MAYSGTISQTVFDTRKVIDSAVRRCKIPAQKITAEVIEIANNELYLFLSQLASQQAPLWCTVKHIYPLYAGAADIVTITGTIDVYAALLRTTFDVAAARVVGPIAQTFDIGNPTTVTTVGVLWGSVPTLPLVFEQSADGFTWSIIGTAPLPTELPGQRSWYDLDVVTPARYLRVTGVTPAEAVSLGNTPSEIPMGRINRDDYVNLPNKSFPSNRPLQFWLDRQVRTPVIRMWPTPNEQAEASQVVVWAHRHIMDVGTMTEEIEVPQRWYDAVVAGLAARLAVELPEADAAMIPILDTKAGTALAIAQNEERDNSTKRIAPDFSAYTA